MIYLLDKRSFSENENRNSASVQTKYYQHLEAERFLRQFHQLTGFVGEIGPCRAFDRLNSFETSQKCIVDPYNEAVGAGLSAVPDNIPYPVTLFRCFLGVDSRIIPGDLLDLSFSISVLEHVGQAECGYDCAPCKGTSLPSVQEEPRDAFCKELFRITKPGGITYHLVNHAARNLTYLSNFINAGFCPFDTEYSIPTLEDCLNSPTAVRQQVDWYNSLEPMPEDLKPLHGVLVMAFKKPLANAPYTFHSEISSKTGAIRGGKEGKPTEHIVPEHKRTLLNYFNYYKYRILSNLTFGNTRKKYKRKKAIIYGHILNKTVQVLSKTVQDDFITVHGPISNRGGSFKMFFIKNNMESKIAGLKRGLDKKSQENVDLYLDRMLILPEDKCYEEFKISKKYLDSITTDEEKEYSKKFANEYHEYSENFPLERDDVYCADVWYFHHGLRFESDQLKNYIKGGDFIDGGAWIGDSNVMLNRFYKPKKVYSFEISQKNQEHFLRIMKLNNIAEDKFELVPLGLSNGKKTIFIDDCGGLGGTILLSGNTECELIDTDSFVKEKNLNVKFIKADLEGSGYDALKGMCETIAKNRPILSLAIYHNPQEFFDMKPLLEEMVKDLDYKITIRRFEPSLDYLAEICLFAYPKELEG